METERIIGILRDIEPEDALVIVEMLLEEGINFIEVSLSKEKQGLKTLSYIKEKTKNTNLKLGVGTVINCRQVELVSKIGVEYIITPGFDKKLVEYALEKNIEVIPGIITPGEIIKGLSLGINKFKVFPAITMGKEYAKHLKGPIPNLYLIAVGGITLKNTKAFLENGYDAVGIGNDLIPRGSTIDDIEDIKMKIHKYL